MCPALRGQQERDDWYDSKAVFITILLQIQPFKSLIKEIKMVFGHLVSDGGQTVAVTLDSEP